MMASPPMYLIDTSVISEARKGSRANAGVQAFFREASEQGRTSSNRVVRPSDRHRSA